MDLELSSEQTMLRDAARRFLSQNSTRKAREAYAASAIGFSEANWGRLAELGWLSLALPEEAGGLANADVEIMIVAEALGRALASEPFHSNVVTCATLLRKLGRTERHQKMLEEVAAGTVRLAFAHEEAAARSSWAPRNAIALKDGDGWRISGDKAMVLDAPSAQFLIVSARREAYDGTALFLVPANSAGLGVRGYRTTDGRKAAEITLRQVQVAGEDMLNGDGDDAITEALDRSVAAQCADAIGAMDGLFELTLEYLKTRKQFGATLGSFQALQHRAADLFAAIELARSMSLYANLSLTAGAEERARAVSQTKLYLVEAARQVGRQGIQLHGGMGMTAESDVGAYFKRLLAFEVCFGSADEHAARIEGVA